METDLPIKPQKNYEGEGLWISPDGEAYRVNEHLAFVQQHPEVLGLSKRDVSKLNLHGLRVLAIDLIKEGWVRYRYLDFIHNFEVDNIRKRELIIDSVLTGNSAVPEEKVNIEQVLPRKSYTGTVQQAFDRKISESKKKFSSKWRFS